MLLTIVNIIIQQVHFDPFSIPSTARIVKKCPSGKAEWNLASSAKNCTSYQLGVPFVYHCLINEFANATVEVCARRVNVLCKNCDAWR